MNQKGYSAIFILLILVIIGIIGGLVYWKTQKEAAKTQEQDIIEFTQPSVSDLQSNFTPPGETTVSTQTGAKTYINKVLSFSITVPHDWNIADYKGVFISSPGEVVFTPEPLETLNPYSTQIAVTSSIEKNARFPYSTEEDFKKYLSEPISNTTNSRFYKIANLKVDGRNAMQYITQSLPGDATDSFYSVITWVYANNKSYYFEFIPADIDDKNFLKIYNNILSTIKFTTP